MMISAASLAPTYSYAAPMPRPVGDSIRQDMDTVQISGVSRNSWLGFDVAMGAAKCAVPGAVGGSLVGAYVGGPTGALVGGVIGLLTGALVGVAVAVRNA
jgi:hypothetical protein